VRHRATLVAVGAFLRRERNARQWTQDALASRIGLTVKHLREIEHGRADPSFLILAHLAHSFDVSLAELFGEAEREVS
jgi:transcriptional regulator with XRE-family HTH domain